VTGALALVGTPIAADAPVGPVVALLAVTGGFINAVQVTLFALAAHVYPTSVRATGVGTAVSIGRSGGVLSPYAGAWALESGGSRAFFALSAIAMTAACAALAAVRRHIPSQARAIDA
jgi:AAHS family 4-hydroxybenzoate transporter-like MFS transporter